MLETAGSEVNSKTICHIREPFKIFGTKRVFTLKYAPEKELRASISRQEEPLLFMDITVLALVMGTVIKVP